MGPIIHYYDRRAAVQQLHIRADTSSSKGLRTVRTIRCTYLASATTLSTFSSLEPAFFTTLMLPLCRKNTVSAVSPCRERGHRRFPVSYSTFLMMYTCSTYVYGTVCIFREYRESQHRKRSLARSPPSPPGCLSETAHASSRWPFSARVHGVDHCELPTPRPPCTWNSVCRRWIKPACRSCPSCYSSGCTAGIPFSRRSSGRTAF